RIGAYGSAVAIESHEPVRIDESRLVVVVAGDAQREGFSHRQVDCGRGRVARVACFVDRAELDVGIARKFAQLRPPGNDAEGAAERAGAVQRALRAAQHFDALDIVELEVAVDRRVADVSTDRRLLESTEAARARTRVQATNDRKSIRAITCA